MPATNPSGNGSRTATSAGQSASPTIDSTDDQLARALCETRALTDRLLKYEQANSAYSKWAETIKNQLAAQKITINQLNQDVTRLSAERANFLTQCSTLKQELEGYNATNAELRSQVGDLMTRNSAVNASAVRFREDLWHSEMRWRESQSKLNELTNAARKLAGEFYVSLRLPHAFLISSDRQSPMSN